VLQVRDMALQVQELAEPRHNTPLASPLEEEAAESDLEEPKESMWLWHSLTAPTDSDFELLDRILAIPGERAAQEALQQHNLKV
jgi:hypothetical protein